MSELVATAAPNSRIKFDRTDIEFSKRVVMGDAIETGLARFAGPRMRWLVISGTAKESSLKSIWILPVRHCASRRDEGTYADS